MFYSLSEVSPVLKDSFSFRTLFRSLTCILLMFSFSSVSAQTACTNIDFSQSSFSGWTTYMGQYDFSGISQGFSTARFSIHTTQGNVPGTGGNLQWLPEGYSSIAQIGNFNSNAQSEMVRYSYTVTDEFNGLEIKLAAMLEDDGHPSPEQPKLRFRILDQFNNIIPCSEYVVVAGDNLEGWTEFNGVDILPWVTLGLDLQAYVNQQVTIECGVMDCVHGGHYGTGFMSCRCVPSEVDARFCEGAELTAELSAPSGYASYQWNTGETTQAITIQNPYIGLSGYVELLSFNGCTLILNYVLEQTSTAAGFGVGSNCQDGAVFVNNSTYLGGTSGTCTWIPENGSPVYGDSVALFFSDYGLQEVTMIVDNDFQCADTLVVEVFIHSNPVIVINPPDRHFCLGDAIEYVSESYNPDGGNVAHTWLLDGVISSTNNTFEAFINSVGTHTVELRVLNDFGCESIEVFQFYVVSPVLNSITTSDYSGYDINCFGFSTGWMNVSASNGAGPFSYQLNSLPPSSNSNLPNLAAGFYTVTVTDSIGCSVDTTLTLTQPNQIGLVADVQLNQYGYGVTCFGGNDGSVSLSGTGGIGPYSISLDQNPTIAGTPVTNVSGGNHNVSVTDLIGCVYNQSITVSAPDPISLNLQAATDYNGFDVSCPEAEDGQAIVNPQGGVQPYQFLWSDGSVLNTSESNSPVGSLYISVSDIAGCAIDDSIQLFAPDSLTVPTEILQHNICYGESEGSILIQVNGGALPINVIWNNGGTGLFFDQLAAATYSYTATDANACNTVTGNLTILEPDLLTIAISDKSDYNGYEISCPGLSDGFAQMVTSGGSGNHIITWNAQVVGTTIQNQSAGIHYYNVTDANGCADGHSITFYEPNTLMSEAIVIATDTCRKGLGGIQIQAEQGVSPYFADWEDGATTLRRDSLTTGNYDYVLYDLNGCSTQGTVLVPYIRPLISEFRVAENCLHKETYFSETVTANYSTEAILMPTYFEWNFGDGTIVEAQNPNHTFSDPGVYSVSLYVANEIGCDSKAVVEVEIYDEPVHFIPNSFTPNNDGLNDLFRPVCVGCESIVFKIFNRWGSKVFDSQNDGDFWDGSGEKGETYCPSDVYMCIYESQGYCDTRVEDNVLINLVR